MERVVFDLNETLRGWENYFKLEEDTHRWRVCGCGGRAGMQRVAEIIEEGASSSCYE